MLHAKCFSYSVFSHYLSLFICVCYLPVVHRSSAVLSGSGQQDDYRNVADRLVLPLLSLEDDWPSYRHLSHFPDHAWWVKTAASDNVESSKKILLLPQFYVCYFLDHEHTDLDPAVLATLKKLQDGYFGGARSDNEAINKCNVINKTYSRAVSAYVLAAFNFARIQTGKLSEFLTTSCCAHLSFLDSGKTRSNRGWDEDDDVEDGSFRGAVHDLSFNDGKGK